VIEGYPLFTLVLLFCVEYRSNDFFNDLCHGVFVLGRCYCFYWISCDGENGVGGVYASFPDFPRKIKVSAG
jgi:hypothetical protein